MNYIINKNCLRDKTITEKYLAKIVSAKNHLVIAIFTILKCLKEYKKKTELTYTFHLNWNVLFSVSSYTLSFANFPFSTIYPAIIRSSGPIEFWEKSVLYKYCKIHKKNLCWNSRVLVLNEVANLQRLTLSKKRPWHRCFLVNFWKFFYKTPTAASTKSLIYPTTTFRFFQNDVTNILRLSAFLA